MPPTIKTFHLLSIIHNFEGSEGVVNMEISADANKVKGSESEKRDGCSTLKSYFFSAGLLSFLFPNSFFPFLFLLAFPSHNNIFSPLSSSLSVEAF